MEIFRSVIIAINVTIQGVVKYGFRCNSIYDMSTSLSSSLFCKPLSCYVKHIYFCPFSFYHDFLPLIFFPRKMVKEQRS